jgi:toxin ParE1/3/4
MFSLVYRHAALADLDAIYDYIEPDNPRRAASFVQDIRNRCRALCDHPKLGRARDDLSNGIRILPMLGRVVVAYRITPSAILVTRVFYGGQDYEAILRRNESDDDRTPE